jgi:hypothetical protein
MPDSLAPAALDAAGIYHGVPMEQYLECEAVSAHDLFALHTRCPAYAYARHCSHPNPEPERNSEALALGSLTHCLILEGDAAAQQRFAMKPEGMTFASNEGKAWKADHPGMEIVKEADWDAAEEWARVIAAHPIASKALEACRSEVTLLARDPETGLAIKNRPDAMRSNLIVNIKTTANARPRVWGGDAAKYGYHVSEAMTAHVLRCIDAPPRKYVYLVIEKAKRNPIIEVYEMDPAFAALGETIMRKSLRQWARCVDTGKWPTYGEGVPVITAPKWALSELEYLED